MCPKSRPIGKREGFPCLPVLIYSDGFFSQWDISLAGVSILHNILSAASGMDHEPNLDDLPRRIPLADISPIPHFLVCVSSHYQWNTRSFLAPLHACGYPNTPPGNMVSSWRRNKRKLQRGDNPRCPFSFNPTSSTSTVFSQRPAGKPFTVERSSARAGAVLGLQSPSAARWPLPCDDSAREGMVLGRLSLPRPRHDNA